MTTTNHESTSTTSHPPTAARHPACASGDCSTIGPAGMFARAAVGSTLISLAFYWHDPRWVDALVAFLVIPAAVTGPLWLRAHHTPSPLRATGPLGHLANAVVFVPLFAHPATVTTAFLFYGASMLVAAARRSGGCEVTAISNALLNRDDQVGCAFFAPVDLAEARLRRPA
jgi:hypothetical protein